MKKLTYFFYFLIFVVVTILIFISVLLFNRRNLHENKNSSIQNLRNAIDYKDYLRLLRDDDEIPNKREYRSYEAFIKVKNM